MELPHRRKTRRRWSGEATDAEAGAEERVRLGRAAYSGEIELSFFLLLKNLLATGQN